MRSADELRNLIPAGSSVGDAIKTLKDNNVSIVDAIKTIRSVYNKGLAEANDLVASHPLYSGIAEAAIPVQDAFFRSLEELADRGVDQNREDPTVE